MTKAFAVLFSFLLTISTSVLVFGLTEWLGLLGRAPFVYHSYQFDLAFALACSIMLVGELLRKSRFSTVGSVVCWSIGGGIFIGPMLALALQDHGQPRILEVGTAITVSIVVLIFSAVQGRSDPTPRCYNGAGGHFWHGRHRSV